MIKTFGNFLVATVAMTISFMVTLGNKCCYGTLFYVLWAQTSFWVFFLHSKPLHGLEVISFPMISFFLSGNTFVSWTYKYFYGFFAFYATA